MSRKDFSSLLVGAILILAVSAIVALTTRLPLVELTQVAMLFAGMLAVAAMSAISRFIDGSSGSALVHISFNEPRVRSVLEDALTRTNLNKRILEESSPPWEPTADLLLTQDPSLALAKLRIDLERELRRLAYRHELPVDAHRMGVPQLTEVLLRREILSPPLVAAIRDVLPACNQAVHGAEVSADVAQSVSNVGQDILSALRSLE